MKLRTEILQEDLLYSLKEILNSISLPQLLLFVFILREIQIFKDMPSNSLRIYCGSKQLSLLINLPSIHL